MSHWRKIAREVRRAWLWMCAVVCSRALCVPWVAAAMAAKSQQQQQQHPQGGAAIGFRYEDSDGIVGKVPEKEYVCSQRGPVRSLPAHRGSWGVVVYEQESAGCGGPTGADGVRRG